jgi:hypothetical protein
MLMDSVYGPKGLVESLGLLCGSNGEPEGHEVTMRKKGRLIDFRRKKEREKQL